eukprot:3934094-Rhodomonas_salina.1
MNPGGAQQYVSHHVVQFRGRERDAVEVGDGLNEERVLMHVANHRVSVRLVHQREDQKPQRHQQAHPQLTWGALKRERARCSHQDLVHEVRDSKPPVARPAKQQAIKDRKQGWHCKSHGKRAHTSCDCDQCKHLKMKGLALISCVRGVITPVGAQEETEAVYGLAL